MQKPEIQDIGLHENNLPGNNKFKDVLKERLFGENTRKNMSDSFHIEAIEKDNFRNKMSENVNSTVSSMKQENADVTRPDLSNKEIGKNVESDPSGDVIDNNAKSQTYANVYEIQAHPNQTKVVQQNDIPTDDVYENPAEQTQTKVVQQNDAPIDDVYENPAEQTQTKVVQQNDAPIDDVYENSAEQTQTKVVQQNDAPIDDVYENSAEQTQTKIVSKKDEPQTDDFYEIPAEQTETKEDSEIEAPVDDDLYEAVIVEKQDDAMYTKLIIHNDSINTHNDKTHQSEEKIDEPNIYVNWSFQEDSEKHAEEVEKVNDVNEDEIVEEEKNTFKSDNEREQLQTDESGVKSYASKFPRIASLLAKLKAKDGNQDETAEAEENRSDNNQDNQLQIEEAGIKSHETKFPRIASFLREPDKVAKTADFIDKNIHKILLGLVISVTSVIILAMIITWTVK
ncbi:unnamed protein product [Owenia fusiformis]|uniref:Uncharacterized protein n=1 Tax=Owenia fusiformis TaxID=6347 RepID=A0A8J1U7S3_OWEFU|nr:unnamed protein product [Owenia fusiformis]